MCGGPQQWALAFQSRLTSTDCLHIAARTLLLLQAATAFLQVTPANNCPVPGPGPHSGPAAAPLVVGDVLAAHRFISLHNAFRNPLIQLRVHACAFNTR